MGQIVYCSTPMGSRDFRVQVIEDGGEFFAAVRFGAWDTGPLYVWRDEPLPTIRGAVEMGHVHRSELLLWEVEAAAA